MDAARANRIVASVFQRLGPRFRISTYETATGFMFGVSEKAPPGEFFDETETLMDGTVRKLKNRNYGGITPQQFAIIADTSLTDEEAVERIIQLIVKKVDTTRLVTKQQGLTMEEVQAIVQKAIAADREARKLDEQRIAEIANAAASRSEPEAPPVLKGLQQRPKKDGAAETAAIDESHRLWRERAELMGMDEPIINQRTRHVDGRWLRRAERRWAEYNQQGATA